MTRLPSIYVRRFSKPGDWYTPAPFHSDEVLIGVAPHDNHPGNMKVAELVNEHSLLADVQAILRCTEPGCNTECLATAVLSDMAASPT